MSVYFNAVHVYQKYRKCIHVCEYHSNHTRYQESLKFRKQFFFLSSFHYGLGLNRWSTMVDPRQVVFQGQGPPLFGRSMHLNVDMVATPLFPGLGSSPSFENGWICPRSSSIFARFIVPFSQPDIMHLNGKTVNIQKKF